MNRVWIDSFVIRAYVPRFGRVHDRDPSYPAWPIRRTKGGKEWVGREKASVREDGRLYAEAVKGERRNEEVSDDAVADGEEQDSVHYMASEAEGEWLVGAFTGLLKQDFNWVEHGVEIQSECLGSLVLTSMGGNLVFVRSEEAEPAEKVLKGLEEWRSFWWKWCRPWAPLDVNQNRVVWTKWLGVPLHAWNKSFFTSCCVSLGRFVKLHDRTQQRDRLDEALVLVSRGLTHLARTITCRINGTRFQIHMEEIQWGVM